MKTFTSEGLFSIMGNKGIQQYGSMYPNGVDFLIQCWSFVNPSILFISKSFDVLNEVPHKDTSVLCMCRKKRKEKQHVQHKNFLKK